ncbi:MAG: DUF4157 domain-containing protein [Bacteroidota bacterium]
MRKGSDKTEKKKRPAPTDTVQQVKSKNKSTSQFKDERPETMAIKQLQSMANDYSAQPIQKKKNDTGLPDQLKSSIENASGYSMDDVKVHRNSTKPSQLNAHAYAQGSEIHLASGQEKHLPHEAWHVVQQKQGRVKPTKQINNSVNINDDAGLEKEADVMGSKVAQAKGKSEEGLITGPAETTTQLVEDESKRQETDFRMDHLIVETKVILKFLKQQGEDWAKIYGEKGKEQAQTMVKDKLEGKKKDYPAEIRREALKRYWASLSAEEKLELVTEAGGVLSKVAKVMASAGLQIASEALQSSGSGSSKSKKKKDEEPAKKPAKKKRSSPSVAWISELTTEDLDNLYQVYKQKKKVMSKIDEYQEKLVDESGKIGKAVGAYVGSKKTQLEFVKRVNERKQDFLVAKKRYLFLRAAIEKNKDNPRYKEELTALGDVFVNLRGPAAIYLGLFDFERQDEFSELCSIALSNLKVANVKRPAYVMVEKVGSAIASGFNKLKTKLSGKEGEEEERLQLELENAQESAADSLVRTLGKSWGGITTFWSKPAGVSAISKAVSKGKTASAKLQIASGLAKNSAGKESKNRDAMTQIFYEALADINVDDLQSVNRTASILKEIGGELG